MSDEISFEASVYLQGQQGRRRCMDITWREKTVPPFIDEGYVSHHEGTHDTAHPNGTVELWDGDKLVIRATSREYKFAHSYWKDSS